MVAMQVGSSKSLHVKSRQRSSLTPIIDGERNRVHIEWAILRPYRKRVEIPVRHLPNDIAAAKNEPAILEFNHYVAVEVVGVATRIFR